MGSSLVVTPGSSELVIASFADRIRWFDSASWDKGLKPAPAIITFALQAISPFVGMPRTGL